MWRECVHVVRVHTLLFSLMACECAFTIRSLFRFHSALLASSATYLPYVQKQLSFFLSLHSISFFFPRAVPIRFFRNSDKIGEWRFVGGRHHHHHRRYHSARTHTIRFGFGGEYNSMHTKLVFLARIRPKQW